LSCKDQSENPWLKFTAKYDVGDIARVKIVKLMPFGAFAEVMEGVDGLIHISQITNRRIAKPGDAVSEGDEVDARITDIDTGKQKISLSIRALVEEPAVGEDELSRASQPDEIVAVSEEGSVVIPEELGEVEEPEAEE